MTSDPWDRIRRPDGGYAWITRKADVDRKCHFGLNSDGATCFLIEAKQDQSGLVVNAPALAGIQTDFKRFDAANLMGMTLELRQSVDRALFLVLCEDLAKIADGPSTEAQTFTSIINRLVRWQRLLAHEQRRLLTTEEIRGLLGELIVISELLTRNPSEDGIIIGAWIGPSGAPQDFCFPNAFIEVKTTAPDQRGIVHIASEYQLLRTDRDIHLATVRVRDASDDPAGLSINDLVVAVSERLTPPVRRLFEEKLGQARYMDIDAYDLPRFLTGSVATYRLPPSAPVLHKLNIPPAVSDIQYTLDTAQLSEFRVADLPEIT